MQASTKKGIIVTVIIVALCGGAYLWFNKNKKSATKLDMVQFIVLSPKTVISSNGNSYQANMSAYMAMGDDYISAWYAALQQGQSTFEHKDKTLSVETGRVL